MENSKISSIISRLPPIVEEIEPQDAPLPTQHEAAQPILVLSLPSEMKQEIMRYLTYHQLVTFSLLSKECHDMTRSELWMCQFLSKNISNEQKRLLLNSISPVPYYLKYFNYFFPLLNNNNFIMPNFEKQFKQMLFPWLHRELIKTKNFLIKEKGEVTTHDYVLSISGKYLFVKNGYGIFYQLNNHGEYIFQNRAHSYIAIQPQNIRQQIQFSPNEKHVAIFYPDLPALSIFTLKSDDNWAVASHLVLPHSDNADIELLFSNDNQALLVSLHDGSSYCQLIRFDKKDFHDFRWFGIDNDPISHIENTEIDALKNGITMSSKGNTLVKISPETQCVKIYEITHERSWLHTFNGKHRCEIPNKTPLFNSSNRYFAIQKSNNCVIFYLKNKINTSNWKEQLVSIDDTDFIQDLLYPPKGHEFFIIGKNNLYICQIQKNKEWQISSKFPIQKHGNYLSTYFSPSANQFCIVKEGRTYLFEKIRYGNPKYSDNTILKSINASQNETTQIHIHENMLILISATSVRIIQKDASGDWQEKLLTIPENTQIKSSELSLDAAFLLVKTNAGFCIFEENEVGDWEETLVFQHPILKANIMPVGYAIWILIPDGCIKIWGKTPKGNWIEKGNAQHQGILDATVTSDGLRLITQTSNRIKTWELRPKS